MSQWAIEAQGLGRQFGDFWAIRELDLQIAPGTIYGFLGPNGCGKTTAIRMLTGLLRPSAGTLSVLGYALPRDAEKLKRTIGYMTQNFSLYRDLTVRENLTFMAQIYGLSRRERRQRIDQLLRLFGLDQRQAQLAGSLSGGQRQRLALAAAIIHKPKLLFLDEPTSAVDPENRREFWEQLFDLCDEGTSILVSTHYMDEAERCHKLAILESGSKRADGAPEQLMAQMGVQVIELEGQDLRRLKQQLLRLVPVRSAAQLGARLRVLIDSTITEPLIWLRQQRGLSPIAQATLVRPSLEDVFVICTGEGRQ
ncbi:ABC transporter ATP-binding protein [Ferrimonas pelagia]|uniref:ABC transporter ATP-binding protein n=1 Tax=Ferrimonas pelagia TaxID=1177826 RepID=A0ABP9ETZ7_9GAMM